MRFFDVRIRTNQIIDEVWRVQVPDDVAIEDVKQQVLDDAFVIWSDNFSSLLVTDKIDTVGVTVLGFVELEDHYE